MKRFELSQPSIILAILAALICLTESCDTQILQMFKIVGGVHYSLREIPYVVSLQRRGKHHCGGIIIAKNIILTAAHCFKRPSVALFSVRSGSDYKDKGGIIHEVERIVVHENFMRTSKTVPLDDIALVWTVSPFNISRSGKNRIIKMFEKGEHVAPGQMGLVSGWGQSDLKPENKLQGVQVPVVSRKACNKAYAEYGGLPEKQICAGYPEGQRDACVDDSGGPFVINRRLVGIVSWGKGCGNKDYPGVYTEVAEYRDWIRKMSGI